MQSTNQRLNRYTFTIIRQTRTEEKNCTVTTWIGAMNDPVSLNNKKKSLKSREKNKKFIIIK